MILFIPMATGQFLPNDVYASIARQTIKIDIIPCVSDGIYSSNHNTLTAKRKTKTEFMLVSRNMAIDWINNHTIKDKYVAMQDRDMVHLFNDNFEKCITFLENNNDYVGVVMPWKDYKITSHIRMCSFIIKTDILKKIEFRADEKWHVCKTLKEDLEKIGKWMFLPSDKKIISENTEYKYPLNN